MDISAQVPTVTKIEVQKKDPKRRSIFLDGKFYKGIDGNTVLKLNIEKGLLWTEEIEYKVSCEELFLSGLKKGIDLIYRSAKTERQLSQKLAERDFPDDVIERVIAKLVAEGFLNDILFSEQFIEMRAAKYGAYRLRQELRQRGVREDDIDIAFENTEQDTEYERALLIGRKRVVQYESDAPEKAYKKLMSYLTRKGFSYDVTKQVLGNLFDKSKLY